MSYVYSTQEDDIETPFGNMHVAIQGDRSKQAILTFHDIGLNREYIILPLENLFYLHFSLKKGKRKKEHSQAYTLW